MANKTNTYLAPDASGQGTVLPEGQDLATVLNGKLSEISAVSGPNINTVGTPSVTALNENGKTTLTFDYLKGEKGEQGIPGADGKDGLNGNDGTPGQNGQPGADGKSAYQIAKDNGYQGTEQEWLASLKGEPGVNGINGTNGTNGTDGVTPHIGENGNWFIGTEDTLKPSRGPKGEPGTNGINGKDGVNGAPGVDGKDMTFSSMILNPATSPIDHGVVTNIIKSDNTLNITYDSTLKEDITRNTLDIKSIKDNIDNAGHHRAISYDTETIYKVCGHSTIIYNSGIPSEDTIPDQLGIPAFIGQIYIDTSTKKVYIAVGDTTTGDWVPLN